MVKNKGEESIPGRMGLSMTVNGMIIKYAEKGCILGPMYINFIKFKGKTI